MKMTDVTEGILCCRSIVDPWKAAAPGLGRFETPVVVVATAETTLLGVVTVATAAGVLGMRPAQPAMTVESRWHPISGMTVVATPVQSHAVDLVADNPGSAGTKRI